MSPDAKAPNSKKLCICCHEEFDGELTVCPSDGTPLSQVAHEDDLVGTVFAERYEILNVIGGGGMGLVYRAKHRFMNRTVAIKVLHKTSNSASELKRFQLEAQAASALSIPNIVTIYDFGTSPAGEPYMVMDFLDGRSLTEILDAEGKFSVPRAVNIFIQISNALSHAHGKGIIHRDIKPSNIVLVNTETESDFVKIVDFGIAKLLDSSDPNSGNLTRTGEVFGSPLYMSPEQWRGLKLDARTDIYSLGSVMYRVLSGKNIFDDIDFLQLMYKHANEMPASFVEIGVSIPGELESIVFKALAKDRDIRFQSMMDLVAALEQFKQSISPDGRELEIISSGKMLPHTVSPGEAPASAIPMSTIPISAVTGGVDETVAMVESRPASSSQETQPIPVVANRTKEDTVQIQIPKRLIGFGVAVSLIGVLAAFFAWGSKHESKNAPVDASPPSSVIPAQHEQTSPPTSGAKINESHDGSRQDGNSSEEPKKAKTVKSSRPNQHRTVSHGTSSKRAVTPAPAQSRHGFAKLKSKLKGLFRKLDNI
ncbi:MAG: serine/threonine protein kinase [Cyanobacteria bacterium SZAS-4]|nr:serine/threonine protein kinase [Cyanobacteria bacterium SZAS-4]